MCTHVCVCVCCQSMHAPSIARARRSVPTARGLPPRPLRVPPRHQVRHPGVSEAIERDFQTMVWLAHAASQLVPSLRSLRLDDTLKQFAAPLHEQVRVAGQGCRQAHTG